MGKIVVYCQPGAKQTQCVGLHDGKPKIQLKAPPVDGAANAALIALLAKQLKRPKSAISLLTGDTARIKRLQIDGLSEAEVAAALVAGPPARR